MGTASRRLEDIGYSVRRTGVDGYIRSGRTRQRKLICRNVERQNLEAHRLGMLDRHMAEAADTRYRDPLAGARLGLLQPLVGGDAGAQDWRHLREIDAYWKPRGKRRRRNHVFGEAAVATISGVVLVFAQRLPTGLAIFATLAGIMQPRDADWI